MTYQNITANSGSIDQINENFQAIAGAGVYGRRQPGDSGLTQGYWGGYFDGGDRSDGTVTHAASNTNYVTVKKSDYTVATSTSSTNYDNDTDYWRVAVVTTGAASMTAFKDARFGPGGVFAGGGGSGGSGDVVGPASSVDNRVVTFDGTTGKLIKDSGLTLSGTNTGDETATTAGALINGATSKTTPVDADFIGLMDSAASNVLKKLSWANLKATLKTYFDTIYTFVNPMTTAGDIIYGGVAGAPTRLGVGTNTHVLTLTAGMPVWAAPSGGGGGTPAGSTTEVQYNNAGAFGASSAFTYASSTLSAPNLTLTGLALTAASATGGAGLRVPHGAAPTSPTNGDVWTTTTGLYAQINGATVGPYRSGDVVGPASAVSGRVATYNGTTGKLIQDGGTLLSALAPLASPALTGTATAVNMTFSGLLITTATATGSAGLRLPHGTAPTSPTNGDLWSTTVGFYGRVNGATVGPFGAAGGGVTGFTTSLNTTSPNNTVNASVLAASGGTTNQDAVITPKGTGALVLGPVPDSTALGGNKRGDGAVDLQINRASNTQVASGSDAIILSGLNNTASGTNSIASGSATQSTATNSCAFGSQTQATGNGAISTGSNTIASGVNSLSLGTSSTTRGTENATAYAPGAAGSVGDRQGRLIPFQASTTDATPTEATSNGGAGSSSNRIVIPGYGPFKIRIEVVAYNAATDDCKSWEIKALAKNVTGPTSAFVGTPSVTVEFADTGASTWTCALAVSGAAIILNVTGAAASNIKWSATAYLVEATT